MMCYLFLMVDVDLIDSLFFFILLLGVVVSFIVKDD